MAILNKTICNIYGKFQWYHFHAEFLKVGRSLILEMRQLKEPREEGLVSLLATDLKSGLTMNRKSSVYALVLKEKNGFFIVGMS